ncbi:response regulator [Sinorhizobium medicae]|uniref:Response regulator n=2 Tax=Sinorhizobium medicae TaxID=110321 RepID=A0A6G1WRP8_9HYPH|nr:response regulator [Sinorhizobium medicae]ABR64273.1 response regulator receiver protein [Sinorhizobium medicae WSM419]MDX0425105.1 response regulator [Sinorhizobium medicae]MDX0432884.1 response regulator [Sinorhizobium medicae]MDX0437944.1 response regulator [Sinorhizobium medicae]MDX0444393.1 response regulator [Sinorhizobium medicae]
MTKRKQISVVDDDESVREALPDLLRSFGFDVHTFDSAEAFLHAGAFAFSDGMILDIAMPGMTGPELFKELTRRGNQVPTIFVTALKDEILRTRLMKDGAVECLFKPFGDEELQVALAAID